MNRFIQDKIPVADSEATMVHRQGSGKTSFDTRSDNIFLVGLRGSGKSTLGKLLARRLGMTFVDTDEMVVQKNGHSIPEIVASESWEAFRRLESDVLQEVCNEKGQVVATGGGIILAPDNLKRIQQSGTTFYLMTRIPTLLQRLTSSTARQDRPPLSDLPLEQELIQCNIQRGPLYMCAATHILHTDGVIEDSLADALEKLGLTDTPYSE
ncbi:shikimate kinase [Desulfonatronum thiosulfatophilum]|uniref:Shikimate kinase n=1 Tax=Desulfonatronum thiosulfatophilum TaxID=617002 RepID=A0A1G6AGZ9_9BACT|nr:shikimate kinase [Desulfonatronum thiosulfatophilum]SDB07711.1 shikimate kinase [Desulfonatronum thiosulfatophilum]